MPTKPVRYTSILNQITNNDTLFKGRYTLDPYQYCSFGCSYCDAASDIVNMKINAAELLEQELQTYKKGMIIIGSVSDPYQSMEKQHTIMRTLLPIIHQHRFPCHILTKAPLILRDIDLLHRIENIHVTISIPSINKQIAIRIEKNTPPPRERLQTVRALNENNIPTGVALIPILPYIIDEELEKIVTAVKTYNARYLLYKLLELKGDQKTIFINNIRRYYPHLVDKYHALYKNSYIPNESYTSMINQQIQTFCTDHNIATTIH